MPEAARFILMRHAPTLWNAAGRIQGQQDSPLTPEGIELARSWGPFLAAEAPDCMMTSDLGRAVRTADLINETLMLPRSSDPRLREQDWGRWTGRTVSEIEEKEQDLLAAGLAAGWDFAPPEGESRLAVWQRASAAILETAAQRPGSVILVVAHEGVVRCLVYRLSGRRFLPSEPKLIKHYHWHELACDQTGLHLRKANAVALPGI